jgi:hypothetical protein
MKCFFDGSEGQDTNGDTWVTLAGWAAPDESWKRFDDTWGRMLRERYPIAPYIHMWEIISGVDPFERVAGWTDTKIKSLVSDAISLLQNRDKMFSFSCRVNISARQRIIADGYAVDEPMTLCAGMCLALTLEWRFKSKIESVYIFFDRGEGFMRTLKSQWLANRTPPTKLSIDPSKRVWDMVANIVDDDMELNPPLQAADMMAWSTTRDLANKLGSLGALDQYMRELIPDHHAIMGEQLLRNKYSTQL